ncbi:hypothetical protein [Nitrosomonas oligotropha]|uniref:Uncharacterized protein n=1 Tax=Nitrosomonas oligotropha TaxID=42354 RepID=A0A1H8NGZ5_9PROT|nr:hypothetical protein [Nitrosomonas oligotropha]SDW96537.1 hypothetical protein SAMN05216300_11460 [Nitrosomonas oligotropha]SEO28865.1 hypothetical protein SAMN05216333_107110 [Nitrosomonas oligotropha]
MPYFQMRRIQEISLHASTKVMRGIRWEMRSFEQVYKDEIYGVLEIAAPIARDVFEGMLLKSTGQTIEHSTNERESKIQATHNLLCAAISKQSVRRALRTLHIGALLHAAVRWNRTQKIVVNDLYDFHHAEAALGYCVCFSLINLCNLFSNSIIFQ